MTYRTPFMRTGHHLLRYATTALSRGTMMLLPILPLDLASSLAPLPERAPRAIWEGRTARRPEGPSTGRGWATPLLASPPSPSPPTLSAKRRREEEETEQKLLAAFALNPTYDVANNLGQTQFRIGKHREAAQHLAYAVLHWPLIGKKDARDLAVKRLDEVKKQVGTLNVSTSAPGADVSLDGAPIARSPLDLPLFVDPGPHALVAKLAGFDDARVEVTIGRGQTQDVSLPLVKLASSQSQGSGSTGSSGSSSAGPLQGSSNKDLPASVGPNRAVLVAGGAAAGAALVAGVVFTVLANGKAAEANARLNLLEPSGPRACVTAAAECRQIDSDWRARDAFSNVALLSFIGTGVLAAGTIVYGLTSPRRPTKGEHARFEALPIVARTGSGVVIQGAW